MKGIVNKFLTVIVLACALLVPAYPVSAASPGSGCTGDADAIEKFLSFPVWYRGLPCDSSGDIDIKGGDPSAIVFTIALNIIDIALRLIGIMAVGFVIWGGFQYITSRGEPERAKSGLVTVRSALIGMVISMIAAFVVSFVVGRLNP
jgi:hypothetical protein